MAGTQAAMAEPSVNDLALRTEVHAFETLTLSDQQLLTGDKNGKVQLPANCASQEAR
jgi:hypothetical protein